MRIKLDENLPVVLVNCLNALGHDVDTVMAENLSGHLDDEIWQVTQQEQRFFITQDLDFSDIRKFKPGTHHGLLLVRLAIPGRRALFRRVYGLFLAENTEAWKGCFVVATEYKLRIRCPEIPDKIE